MSTVDGWTPGDVVAAVESIDAEARRCPECGLTDEQKWWVSTELVRCPSCEDAQRLMSTLKTPEDRAGMRIQFEPLGPDDDPARDSAMRTSYEARRELHRRQKEQQAQPATGTVRP